MKAIDGYVERLRRYSTLLPQQTHMFIEEFADLLEFYEEQNAALLGRQDELLSEIKSLENRHDSNCKCRECYIDYGDSP
jgi:hypothetical protein